MAAMTIFRYTLDRSSKTFKCPKCQRKKLVRYVDSETLEYVSDPAYGRCNAESSCGYLKTVPTGTKAYLVRFKRIKDISPKSYALTDLYNGIDYVPKSQILELGNGEAWVSAWFIENSKLEPVGEPKYFDNGLELVNEIIENPERKEVKLPSYHPLEMLEQSTPDNLTRWLLTKFSPKEVREAVAKYNITGVNNPWQASTVFWQIDLENRVRGGKVLHYGINGKRTKDPYPRISWVHSILKAQDFNLVQCLYGLNLVQERPEAEIGIVESEKTAIYMSIKEPGKVWLSCGSISGLKPQLLEPIKSRKITAYPDKGCYEAWLSKANAMNNIKVDKALEVENLPDGSDLIDFYELNKI